MTLKTTEPMTDAIATKIQFAREELGINALPLDDAINGWLSASDTVGKILMANSDDDAVPETITVPLDDLMSLVEANEVLIWLMGFRAGGIRS
jgi:hypothetical protein